MTVSTSGLETVTNSGKDLGHLMESKSDAVSAIPSAMSLARKLGHRLGIWTELE